MSDTTVALNPQYITIHKMIPHFIELTHINGIKIFININNIRDISPEILNDGKERTTIAFISMGFATVTESYEQVKKLINLETI